MRILLVFFMVCLLSCSDDSGKLANEFCDCLKESGLKSGADLNTLPYSFNEKNECFDLISKKIYETMKPLNQEERAELMRNFSKKMLETECADILFELLPYDEMLNEMERDLKINRDTENPFSFPGKSSEPTVCDCVKMSEEMSKLIDEAGDDETKLQEIQAGFKNEVEACKKLSEGLSSEEMNSLIEEAKKCR